ncbi:hypothetical protein TcG_04268 [Trypanosoma cruzi]|nr:hypothetical protein TcG_04268 [Trypanosoma cruzi]
MKFTAREAIAYLQRFVEGESDQRFYVVSEPSPAANARALSFMESCWNSEVQKTREAASTTSDRAPSASKHANNKSGGAVGSAPVERPQSSLDNLRERASVVFHDIPPVAAQTTSLKSPDDAGGFFSTAVVPAEQGTSGRIGRNGIAWVVL